MIDYTIDQTQRLIRVRMHGASRCAELEQHLADAYRDPHYHPSLRALFHIDDDVHGPIVTELPQVRTVLELAANMPGALKKWAVVVRPTLERTILEFVLKGMRLNGLEMRFFDDEPSAIAWLDRP
jgi:hypothetical protein